MIKAQCCWLWLGLITCASVGLAQAPASDPNAVTIRGYRRDRIHQKGAGHTTVVRPVHATDSQTDQALEEQSYMIQERSGTIRSSGTTLPRIRGQDARSTEVFFENVKLQDPYTGFPLVQDIDLRALGHLALGRGIGDYRMATTNPVGSLSYRLPATFREQLEGGSAVGRPYGASGWLLGRDTTRGGWEYQLFMKKHKTDGRYEFYDDNGTPFNESDDRRSWRQDNHSESHQIAPVLRYRNGPHGFQYFSWYGVGEEGVPSLGGREETGASKTSQSTIHVGSYGFDIEPIGLRTEVFVINQDSEIKTRDPEEAILVTRRRQTLASESWRYGVQTQWDQADVGAKVQYERGTSKVQSTEGRRTLERDTDAYYTGLRLGGDRGLSGQIKGQATLVQDASDHRKRTAKGSGATIAYLGWSAGIYFQLGQYERVPSLYESFGDGAMAAGNEVLRNEVTLHRELGGYWNYGSVANLQWALFQDDLTDKIVLVPISAQNALKPLNLDRTQTRGIELGMSLTGKLWALHQNATYLRSVNLETADKNDLPGVPRLAAATKAELIWEEWSSAVMGRYRSAVYRDVNNKIEAPGAWVFDWQVNLQLAHLGVGLAIDNVLNTQSVAITSSETGERGRTAFSEINGYPLPGRTWRLEAHASL